MTSDIGTGVRPAEAATPPALAVSAALDDPPRRSLPARITPRWWIVTIFCIVLAQLLARWWAVLGLDSYHDDVAITYQALQGPLTRDYLLGVYAGHWGPLTRVVEWVVVHAGPFNPGVSFGAVLALLVVADVGMALLLRRLFGAGLISVFVFVLWAFTPVMASTLGSWSLGLGLVPILAGMAWTTLFHVRVLQGAGSASAVVAVVLLASTLLLSPQSLFLVLFLPLLSVAYPAVGGAAITLRDSVRRSWYLWTGYGLVLVGYLVGYLSAHPTRASKPLTVQGLGDVVGGLFVSTAAPGLFGGPWASDDGSLPSVAQLSPFALSLVLQAVVSLVIASMLTRRSAWRGWAVLLVLVVIQVVVVATAVRSDVVGEQLLRQTRYLVPLLVPACVLLGAVFAWGEPRRWYRRVRSAQRWHLLRAVAFGVVLLALFESSWLTNYAQAAAMKGSSTATFWHNVRSGFPKHPGVSIVDRQMPGNVLFGGFLPDFGPMSASLAYFVTDQKWDVPAEQVYVVTDDGVLSKAVVGLFASSYPGQPGCGYPVRDKSGVPIALNRAEFNFGWGIRLNYLAAADTSLEVEAAGTRTKIPVHKGIGSVTWTVPGVIDRVVVRSADPHQVGVCVDQVVVGGLISAS